MNSVVIIGRLTRNPEVRYTQEGTAIANFTLAVDRPTSADKEKQTDFPRVTVFGKQAENCERYLEKGRLVGVQGSLRTGSHTHQDGVKVYTTVVVANGVKFLDWGDKGNRAEGGASGIAEGPPEVPEGGRATQGEDGDIPF
jgi:single-strand DNA-binding protein